MAKTIEVNKALFAEILDLLEGFKDAAMMSDMSTDISLNDDADRAEEILADLGRND